MLICRNIDRIISGINRTIKGGILRKLIPFPPVEALSAYPNALVSIYTGLGENVYTGKGADAIWYGTFKGNPLPTGSYVYVINLKNSQPLLTGKVFLVSYFSFCGKMSQTFSIHSGNLSLNSCKFMITSFTLSSSNARAFAVSSNTPKESTILLNVYTGINDWFCKWLLSIPFYKSFCNIALQ